jgi:hypothetical protein
MTDHESRESIVSGESYDGDGNSFVDIFKLIRLIRIKQMMDNSYVLKRLWERIEIDLALFIHFLLGITLASHWIGCIWCYTAFLEVGSFDDSLLDHPNWIANWYKLSYIEGGMNPIGWQNAMSRYFLSLFWAVQSITSIGYGNIQPVTLTEYAVASVLMLVCGIYWSYIIGKLVEVAATRGHVQTAFTSRMNQANQMISDFAEKELPRSVIGTDHTSTLTRVRRFITHQKENATKDGLHPSSACSFLDAYPTLRILSPELQRVSALHLAHSLLETVPYLSSKYLSPEEQASVILQSVIMEISSGETFVEHPDLGRGCFLYRHGNGCMISARQTWRQGPVNVNEVLLDDDHFKEHHTAYKFVGFAKVLFVPRSVIVATLNDNERAWKECARWRYFMAAFVFHSSNKTSQRLV